jgi:hypothetical protein
MPKSVHASRCHRGRRAAAIAAVIVLSAWLNLTYAHAATFVGTVEGSGAAIAIAKDGRKIGGYVCDDGTISRWLAYRWLHKGAAPLVVGTTGETIGSVEISGGKATGTIVIGGQSLPFRAKRVRASDHAGLYFAIAKQEDRLLVGGWIVDPDGTQRGAVSRVNMRTLQPLPVSPAPRIDPTAPIASIGGDTGVPPVVTEPQQLVVINIIAILIGLLVPAVQA